MTGTLVVGGSIGGVRTVQQLRRLGYDRPVTLVEAELHAPYDRPPLSKEVLLDEAWAAPTLLDAQAARDLDVELLLGSPAVGADPLARTIALADGRTLGYDDALVVATGARARRSPWSGRPRVHELRTWDDARTLRGVLDTAASIVVIGAGFIGAEVAAAAQRRGIRIDLVDVAPVPMGRHLGAEVGALFVDLHRRHGATAHFGTGVESLESDDAVTVRLQDGTVLTADAAIVGLGTELNLEWLEGSGLTLEDGLVCDAFCAAAPGVFAVGDVSRWWHPDQGLLVRTEHWTNAVEQAAVVAHNIARPEEPREHRPVGYVWSNQYDWKVQIAGRPEDGVRHELVAGREGQFAAVYADADDALCGVLTVNWPVVSVRGRKALVGGASLDVRPRPLVPGRRPLRRAP